MFLDKLRGLSARHEIDRRAAVVTIRLPGAQY